MFNIVYLPTAKRDISEIAYYISDFLSSPATALKLVEKFEDAIKRLEQFPYSCKIYTPIKTIELELRTLLVDNYIVFYSVHETAQSVTIHRVIYNRMDNDKHIK